LKKNDGTGHGPKVSYTPRRGEGVDRMYWGQEKVAKRGKPRRTQGGTCWGGKKPSGGKRKTPYTRKRGSVVARRPHLRRSPWAEKGKGWGRLKKKKKQKKKKKRITYVREHFFFGNNGENGLWHKRGDKEAALSVKPDGRKRGRGRGKLKKKKVENLE